MVDKQIDMLSAALAKNPKALGFAALDSKAAIPLLKKAQTAKIPVVAFDSGVDSDIPVTHRQPPTTGPPLRWPPTRWPRWWAMTVKWLWSPTTRPAAPASTVSKASPSA